MQKDSIITKPLGVALSAVRRLQQFTRAEITTGDSGEREEVDKARAALIRMGRIHAKRIGLPEEWVERIVVDGDITLPIEEVFRALLDFAGWLVEACGGETEQVSICAEEILRQVHRLGRQWAGAHRKTLANLDTRLLKGEHHGGR